MTVSGSSGSDRRLVVYENNSKNQDAGRLIAIDPKDATGIAVPAFEIGTTLPATGTVKGQGYLSTSAQAGFVWSGKRWEPIAPSPIKSYATEAQLLADSGLGVGTYAVAGDTGSMYAMRPSGWTLIGIAVYDTLKELLATAPASGSMAEALDDGSLWEMTKSKNWRCTSVRELKDTQTILLWNNPGNAVNANGVNLGDRALALDVGVSYVRTGTGWLPTSIWAAPDEATIRAATWALDGQQAIAGDTGRVFERKSGAWVEEPIQHYPTEAALLAATAPNGVLAWGDDTAAVYARSGDRWVRANGEQIYDPVPIGAISAFAVAAIPAGWLLCDGSAIPAGADYDELRRSLAPATTVPDLRGRFLRGRMQDSDPLLNAVDWSTGTPRVPFQSAGNISLSATLQVTGTAEDNGNHTHSTSLQKTGSGSGNVYSTNIAVGDGGNIAIGNWTNAAGGHTHTVKGTAQGTVGGGVVLNVQGGDSETAPDHITVIYAIKAQHAVIASSSSGSAAQLMISSPKNNQMLRFDGAAGVWANDQPYKLSELVDCHELATAVNGQVPAWNQAALRWEPKAIIAVGCPIGTVAMWVLDAIPAGWLKCDGARVDATLYPELAALFPTLPDFRGAFIRGAGLHQNGRWGDASRAVGSWQESATARPAKDFTGTTAYDGNHTHRLTRMMGGNDGEWRSSNIASGNGDKNPLYTETGGLHRHVFSITGGGDDETRPKNFAVHYIMKAA